MKFRPCMTDETRYALLDIKRERDGLQRSWTLKDGVFCP